MFDPTAGERARAIREDPGARHPIVDPTDPRYVGRRRRGGVRRRFTSEDEQLELERELEPDERPPRRGPEAA